MSAIEVVGWESGFQYVEPDLRAYETPEEAAMYDLYVENEHWLENPTEWVDVILGEWFWSTQEAIANSVVHNRFTAVPSCHDAGKSFTVSRLAAWWLNCHAPGEAFVVSTAPTFPQVRAILWREINMAHKKGNLIGQVNQTEWHIPGFGLVGFGRKPADTNAHAFQGIHTDNVLVIIDEACGVAKQIFDAAETLVTNEGGRLIAIGNPDDPSSQFAEVCKPGSGYEVIRIDGLETPNFTGEWVPPQVRPKLLHPIWVEERKKKWGENSPIYQSKVRGLFPEGTTDGTIRWTDIAKAQYVDPEAGEVELGLDVGASVDGDKTIIRLRYGNQSSGEATLPNGYEPHKATGISLPNGGNQLSGWEWQAQTDQSEDIAALAIYVIHLTGATKIKVDVIGVGFGVAGHIRAERKNGTHNCKVVPVNVSEKSSNPKRFANLRAQIWWEVGREGFEEGLYSINGLDDDTLGELQAPKYEINSKGQIVIEAKEETRKRLDASPDHADAWLLAHYHDVKTGKGRTGGSALRGASLPHR